MPLFWLAYKNGKNIEVVIQPARHTIEARMRANMRGQKGYFVESHELDPTTASRVPAKMTSRTLTIPEAEALLKKLG